MPAYDVSIYHRARRDGTPAASALRLARWVAADRLDVPLPGERPLTIERDGFTLTIRSQYDESPHRDEFDGTIDWGHWSDDAGRRVPDALAPAYPVEITTRDGIAWFVSGVPIDDRIDYYRRHGASRSVALDAARADVRAEAKAYDGTDGPTVLGVIVKASRAGVALGESSCWGIEIAWSDVTRTDGSEYLSEVAEDMAAEAIAEAETALAALLEGATR